MAISLFHHHLLLLKPYHIWSSTRPHIKLSIGLVTITFHVHVHSSMMKYIFALFQLYIHGCTRCWKPFITFWLKSLSIVLSTHQGKVYPWLYKILKTINYWKVYPLYLVLIKEMESFLSTSLMLSNLWKDHAIFHITGVSCIRIIIWIIPYQWP